VLKRQNKTTGGMSTPVDMVLESGTRFSLQARSYTETARKHIKLLTYECTSFAKDLT
jgi:hypothetical protein